MRSLWSPMNGGAFALSTFPHFFFGNTNKIDSGDCTTVATLPRQLTLLLQFIKIKHKSIDRRPNRRWRTRLFEKNK